VEINLNRRMKKMNLRNKTALITGATGLIGSNLAERLLTEGAKVIAVGRNEKKLRTVFEDKLDHINFSYVVADISKKISYEAGRVDFIFHAASPVAGQEIRDLPVDVIEANLSGIKNCLEYLVCQKEKSGFSGRLIVFSSVTVYGGPFSKNRFEKGKSVTENDAYTADSLNPASVPYSESKRMVEVIAQAYYRQYGIDSVIARIGYVYGYTKQCPDTAVYEFIGKAVRGEDIILNNSGMARRDNIYISDVVNALIILCMKGEAGEVYNVSSAGEKGNFKAIDEIAALIASSVNSRGNNIKVIKRRKNERRKQGVVVDNHKLKALGWALEVGIEEGLRQTLWHYLQNRTDKR